MTGRRFDRSKLRVLPLSERTSKVVIERDHISPETPAPKLSAESESVLHTLADQLVAARESGFSRIMAFGAHTIKNGLAPVLQWLIGEGWITHLATNGAGIIHDWEFAFQGQSSEDVRANVAKGRFGIWEETGRFINLALIVGAYHGLGYGESIGALVENDGLEIPNPDELRSCIAQAAESPDPSTLARAAAAAELLAVMISHRIDGGRMQVRHPYKQYGLQAAAYRLGVPFTGHPMFGHDIIYTHPLNNGAAVGRTAERDFLSFVNSVCGLGKGVYLSVGSAVMSPMIFEKSLSMCRNTALQRGEAQPEHHIYVVDLAGAPWDWQRDGEPPADNPAYYLRFLKTFHRMGGATTYLSLDNRAFLLRLVELLRSRT